MTNRLVVYNPEIMSGALCITGTRVPVKNLFDYLEGTSSLEMFLDDFPSVSREMAVAVLEAARLQLGKGTDAVCRSVDALRAEELTLAPDERSLLLERLMLSFDDEAQLQDAWVEEARRRNGQIERGETSPRSVDEVLARVRASIA